MNKKLTLGELVPYLEHDVNMIFTKSGKIKTLTGLFIDNNELRFCFGIINVGQHIWNYIPALHPMSDLTDAAIEDLYFEYEKEVHASSWKSQLRQLKKYGGTNYELPLSWWRWLYRNHYDINNLIGQNKAVDINTLDI